MTNGIKHETLVAHGDIIPNSELDEWLLELHDSEFVVEFNCVGEDILRRWFSWFRQAAKICVITQTQIYIFKLGDFLKHDISLDMCKIFLFLFLCSNQSHHLLFVKFPIQRVIIRELFVLIT
jgi:hypothetical protein